MTDDAESKPRGPYTPRSAAAKAKVHRKTIYKAIQEGQIAHFWLGGKLLIPRRPFDQLVDEGKVA
jgi:excisionase family DNA binding protein